MLVAGLAFAAPAHAASSGVKVVGCESSLDPAGRAATFEGRMRVRKSARKMQMRFTLQTRSAEAPGWHKLAASGFGKWLTSDPGVGRYVYTKRVVALEAPASYRTLVRFRWLDADGDRVASAKATSADMPPGRPAAEPPPAGRRGAPRRRRRSTRATSSPSSTAGARWRARSTSSSRSTGRR